MLERCVNVISAERAARQPSASTGANMKCWMMSWLRPSNRSPVGPVDPDPGQRSARSAGRAPWSIPLPGKQRLAGGDPLFARNGGARLHDRLLCV
jgi:hypothetical protein